MIGSTVSHYKILEKLGEGGMGVVYKARDLNLDRLVALKFLPTAFSIEEEAKQRFIHEAKSASSLQHNNICTIHEIGKTDDGQLFISMDLYEGETLKQKIKRDQLKTDEATDIAIQIAEGLLKAHEKDITHRDIKPANIFITNDGVVKILDFGLAKVTGQTQLTQLGSTVGTVAYMSPEQTRGEKIDHRTDIWSLGVVFYEMLTGQLPFKGEYDQVLIYSILDKEPEKITSLNPKTPTELEYIVSRALEKDLALRYQNIEEMLTDLLSFKKNSTISNSTQSIAKRKEKKKRLKTAIISTAIIVFSSIIFYLISFYISSKAKNNVPITLAVISFENQTGDSSYNYLQKAIPNLLITNLEQSEHLRVTTWERMHDLLKQIDRDDVEVINKDLGFELCRMEGIDAIVIGSFIKAGNVFATDVKVLDAVSKKILKSANTKSEGLASIIESQIDYLSEEIEDGIGLTTREIKSVQLRIADVTTTSMEAYNYFLRGREEFEKRYIDDARRFFEKAIEKDSTLAVAHLYLAWAYGGLRYIHKKEKAFVNAKIFSKKATEKERLYIEAAYAGSIESDWEKGYRILKQMAKKYPREKRVHISLGTYYRYELNYKEAIIEYNKALELDPEFGPAFNLLAHTYSEMENYEKAIEYFNKYASMSPGDADPYDSMGELYFKLGELDDAIGKFKEALEIKSDFGSEPRIAYIYALKENYTETMKFLDHIIETARSPGIKMKSYSWRAIYHSLLGNFSQSLIDINRGIELSKSAGNKYGVAAYSMVKGWIYFERGDYELSRKYFEEYNNFVKDDQYLYDKIGGIRMLAYLDVREKRIDSAKLRISEIEPLLLELSEKDPYWQGRSNFSHFLQMEILMAEGAYEDAIAVAEKSSPLKIPSMGIKQLMSQNIPFLQDVLARAYYKNGELDKVITEYERLLTFNPNSKDRRLIHPKYHFRLAKLYEEKGLREKAISEYEKFLEIWKYADKDLPEFIDAKNRLAKLVTE
ncbi:protein kinase [Bacteroidota bacterium]